MAKYCGLHNRLDTQETKNWGALLRCCPLYTGGILLAVDCASTVDCRLQIVLYCSFKTSRGVQV